MLHRSTRTALGVVIALGLLVLGVTVLLRTWRGLKPAVAPPPTPISDLFPAKKPTVARASPVPLRGPKPNFPLTLPEGFDITLYVSGMSRPRVLAVDPTGTPLVSDSEAGTVLALPDENGDGAADKKVSVLTNLNAPHGLAFRGNTLYVAETDAVTRYTYDATRRTAGNPQKVIDLPAGGSHTTRTIAFGPDGMLYVSVGSSCNVCRERDERRAAILRVNPDTGAHERWAWGVRNTVFFTFHPDTGVMLGNDMGRDHLGDELPPDELNVMTGGDYGWPYCYGKKVSDPFGEHPQGCATTEPSLYDYPAHVAPLGIRFIPETFSKEFAGDLLVAFHGSWNRSTPTGYTVVRLDIEGDRVKAMDNFLTGFLTAEGRALGRPVDVLFLSDGSLLVSDDHAGAVYKIVPTTLATAAPAS
jgi:glucose/arabinose dehydrogenase